MHSTTHLLPLHDAAARRRWQALWEDSPQRSAFASVEYVAAAAQAFGLHNAMLLVEEGGTDTAGALLFWRQRGPYRQVVLPPFTQYTPLMLRAHPKEADVNRRRSSAEALLAALERRFHHIRLFCPLLPDVRPALWRGWTATPFYTYLLNLRTPDLEAAWSSSTRREVRKHGADFVFSERPDAAPDVVRLCTAGYERHGRTLPADPDWLLALIRNLCTDGLARIFTVRPREDERIAGAVTVLHDGRTAHYWVAGSEPGPAMTVLLAHLLPYLSESGFTQFDFVGANTPSIAEFKRRFGASLTPYFRLAIITRPELRLLQWLKGS